MRVYQYLSLSSVTCAGAPLGIGSLNAPFTVEPLSAGDWLVFLVCMCVCLSVSVELTLPLLYCTNLLFGCYEWLTTWKLTKHMMCANQWEMVICTFTVHTTEFPHVYRFVVIDSIPVHMLNLVIHTFCK